MLIRSKQLETASKNILIDEINTSPDFALLVSEIQKHHSDVEVKQTDVLQLEFPPNEVEEGLKLNAIFVSLTDEVIVQGIKEINGLRVKAHYSAVNAKGEKVIRKAIVKNKEIEVEAEIPFSADYFLFVEELINPKGADEVSDVAPQGAWYEGCLSFFNSGDGKYYNYKYCGATCTGKVNGESYKATPINTLDDCCRSHDRCWSNFGKGDDGCDSTFYNCANKTSDPGWWMVAEFALLCSQGKLGSIC